MQPESPAVNAMKVSDDRALGSRGDSSAQLIIHEYSPRSTSGFLESQPPADEFVYIGRKEIICREFRETVNPSVKPG
jgi:hypothetical protein